jgi:DNA-binding transcriptional ArsR family regulator
MDRMDEVFKAMNDPHRRRLLDELRARDGQTLGDLCSYLPAMTRFGVMNHLRVLEDAGLVVTRREGRSKLHYLNPVPIRQVHDRWISKYTEPLVGSLTGLKAELEGGRTSMTTPTHVYQVFINATVQATWNAIVDGDQTVQYYYGTRVDSDFRPGSPVTYAYPDGRVAADGEIIAADEPKRLELTFHPRWDPALEAEGCTRMVWAIDDVDGAVRLTVECHDLDPGSKTYTDFVAGIPYIVSGLKTLLETGAPMASD